jgi:hypothetical protein
MTPDIADIATRLRQTRADMIGTDDEQHYWDCVEAAAEIELLEAAYKCSGSALAVIDGGFQNAVQEIQRLRLTDAEREAIEQAIDATDGMAPAEPWAIATLRGLLGRMSGNGDCLAPDNATIRDNSDSPQPIAKCDATPQADATPGECSVPTQWTSRPYWVDPPSGHRYGFPRLYDPAKDGDMTAWMIRHGYPERLADQGLACTFTACTETGEK